MKQEAGVDHTRNSKACHSHSAPLVSVLIPTYNRLGLLQRAVQSVMDQTYAHYELIVIDDGSQDSTSEWLAKRVPAVRAARHGSNRGVAAARNTGLSIANGSVIAFLDSDDVWRPKYLERQVASLSQNQSAVFSYCGRYSALRGHTTRSVICTPIAPNDCVRSMLFGCFVHSMSQIVIPRPAFDQVGMRFRELPACEDFELYLRLLIVGSPVRVDEDLMIKHCLPDSCSLRDHGTKWLHGFLGALEMFYMMPESIPYAGMRAIAEASIYKQIGTCLFESLWGNGIRRIGDKLPSAYCHFMLAEAGHLT